jgi:hypothetical protein
MKVFVYLNRRNRRENLSAAVDYSRSDDAIIAKNAERVCAEIILKQEDSARA